MKPALPPAVLLRMLLAFGLLVTPLAWARPDKPPAAPPPEEPAAAEPASGEEAPVELPIQEMPRVKTYVDAPYPPEALAAGLSGQVGLQVTLDATGAVLDAKVSSPAGHGFDEAALEAVRQMTFEPARTAEGPVGVVFEFTYAFQLTTTTETVQGQTTNLEGRIREMGGGGPVVGAEISLEGLDLTTTTGADGRFSLQGVPTGTWQLRVLETAHEVLVAEVEIADGKLTTADLWMKRLGQGIEEVVITYAKPKQEVTQRTLTIDEVKRVPGTFGDPVKVIQTLPGAARSPFGTGLLIIRGANPEDTAVYVDGIRVPIIYHLTGTTSVLSPDSVQSVEYMPGGYGVQFGRSTAGTVNVVTKDEFKERKLIWGTDILDTQLWFEGAVGKNKAHGLAIGARRSYIDVFIPIFNRASDFQVKPVYWDYQLKWVPKLGDDQKFSMFVYGFQDIIKVTRSDDTAVGTDQDTQGDLRTTYQSHRFVLRYQKKFSDKLSFNFDPSLGVDLINLGLGEDFGLDNWNVILQIRSELHWQPTPAVEIVPGIDFIGGPWRFDFKSAVSFADLDDPLAERDPVGFDGKGTAWSPDSYIRMNLRPLADRDRWLISVGLRASTVTYVYGGGITFGEDVKPSGISGFESRLATRYRAFDVDGMTGTLKASTGWYSQPPQPFESIGLGVTADLVPERAWNSSLGFEHKINQTVSWDFDAFYRRMDRLVEFNDSFVGRGSQPFANTGQGYAAGFELILRHAPANHFFGWLSYTFSRSFRRDGSADSDQKWYPFDFDQPHIFSAQGGYDLPFDLSISAQLQIVSGNPDTKYDAGIYDVDGDFYNGFQVGAGNAERLPTFVQTSFRIDKTWTFRRWVLVTYLDLINAVRGVNPETTIYNYDYSEWAYVRGLPFIPNLGFEARFRP